MSRVLKFGGSSVADAGCMRQVVTLVKEALPHGPLVVLSAMGKTTNGLFAAAKAAEAGRLDEAMAGHQALLAAHRQSASDLFDGALPKELEEALSELFGELDFLLRGVAMLRELSPRSMDAVAAFGERLSTTLFAAHLRAEGVAATWVDARSVMRTDAQFGAAVPQIQALEQQAKALLLPHLGPGRAVVTQGYIGATEEGITTTLGRGGSDYSAALFAAAVGADEVQIWTDVEGVLTCDPRIVPGALPIPELSFAEAGELAAFGAKVLHPATIQPAVEARIPVTVRHTLRPNGRFTTITGEVRTGRPVTALASRGPITVLTVTSTRMLAQSGFLAKIFDVFARHQVSVDLIATAEVSVSLTVEADAPLKKLPADLDAFAKVEVAEGRAIVAVVGERLKATPGVAGRAFAALGGINVEMISMGANEINLSLVLVKDQAPEALRRLHAALIEEGGR